MTGLSETQARNSLAKYGYNQIRSQKQTIWQKLLKHLISPITLMLLAASALSYFGGRFFDAFFILVLAIVNLWISLYQENKADKAIDILNQHLRVMIKTQRDGKWKATDSTLLVPGDLVELSSGSVIPADIDISLAAHLSINEAAVTGESLPQDKTVGQIAYSGTFVISGLMQGLVKATGTNTSFGQTITLAEGQHKKSILENDIMVISSYLMVISLIAVIILTTILLFNHAPVFDVITLALSLIIAGVPVSLPTVITLIISFGVTILAGKKVIVRRLSSLEDLANVNLLLSDKTGTLTSNKISVSRWIPNEGINLSRLQLLANLLAARLPEDSINKAILESSEKIKLPKYSATDYVPADSENKHSTATLAIAETGGKTEVVTARLGAPQVVAGFCRLKKEELAVFNQQVDLAANRGYRTLALAAQSGDETSTMLGLILLSDQPFSDSAATVKDMINQGIDVRMVTGDHRAIAARIANQIGIIGPVITRHDDEKTSSWKERLKRHWLTSKVYAEVTPEDKLDLVNLASRRFVVAVTGDGVNDLPAVNRAQVGFAVSNAVEALKESADIVLLSHGLSVIKDAIFESRRIFARFYTYALYRISESLRLIITVLVLGIIFRAYPLTPLQLILLVLLNDLPIISLATDRVKHLSKPAIINVKRRFVVSTLFGMVGVSNSLIFYFGAIYLFHLPMEIVKTLFFLKLAIGGQMLIYVAHTEERWYKYLPSKPVIYANIATQILAITLGLTGWFMPAAINPGQVAFIWIWAFIWMQITEITKYLHTRYAFH